MYYDAVRVRVEVFVQCQTDLGEMSIPCRMKAPSANQRLLKMVKSLVNVGPFSRSSICHS